jgi:hypothetical protein
MSPTRIASEVDKEKGKPNSYFMQCHYSRHNFVVGYRTLTLGAQLQQQAHIQGPDPLSLPEWQVEEARTCQCRTETDSD